VLDSINLEREGVPSVTLVLDRFKTGAKVQAKLLNLPSLKLAIIPEGRVGVTYEEERQKIDVIWDSLVASLII
jgi:hypothetical protein